MPLTLTLLSAAVLPEKRGLALGAWGGIGGLAIAFGPVVGGAVVEGIAWQWIFWLNVPIGIVLVPLALRRLTESHGPAGRLDLPGVALASAGLFGIVWGLVRANTEGWVKPGIVASFAIGALLVAGFVAWELRTRAPMLPMGFFRLATFSLANLSSLLMFFGMFGSIFLLAQFFQTVQGYSPLSEPGSGSCRGRSRRCSSPLLRAPSRTGSCRSSSSAPVSRCSRSRSRGSHSSRRPTVPYSSLVAPFIVAGVGMALFFAPVANVVLSAVRPEQEGQASGANNAIRELGGVFGVAVLAAVFADVGGYESNQAFSDGMNTAVLVGAAVVAIGAVAAFAIPGRRSGSEMAAARDELAEAA